MLSDASTNLSKEKDVLDPNNVKESKKTKQDGNR